MHFIYTRLFSISIKAVDILQILSHFHPEGSRYFLTATRGPGPCGGTGAAGWIAEAQPRFSSGRDLRLALNRRITEGSESEATRQNRQALMHLSLNNRCVGLLYLRIRIRL